MEEKRSNYLTPDQPSRVKKRMIDPSPNLNLVLQGLPDLTPPRKNKYTDTFASIGTNGASPSGTEFIFPRAPGSSPGDFRTSDGKQDSEGFDLLGGLKSTPIKGPASALDFSSPRSGALNPPPVPIFHPSPRRPSDASTYGVSPESRQRRSSLSNVSQHDYQPQSFTFSPQPAGASNGQIGHSLTSAFASILGDGHSRVSPTNLAAAARGDTAGLQSHFGGMFGGANGAADGTGVDAAGSVDARNAPSALVPVDGALPGGSSPLQLSARRHLPPRSATRGSDGDAGAAEEEDQYEDEGYEDAAARRPNRRRALDFGSSPTGAGHDDDEDDNDHPRGITGIGGSSGLLTGGPLSPPMAPLVLESLEALLPIARLREGADGEDVSPMSRQPTAKRVSPIGGKSGSGRGILSMDSLNARSPVSMRPGIMRREDIIDSPAVKEATNAAVAAAMQAATSSERRPQRAAAAGAALAAAAAAGGTPISRRPSAAAVAAANPAANGLFDGSALLDAGLAGGIRCNCKKSRCLKLYCDCFKALGYCGEGCSCVGCSNREDNADIVNNARDSILARNPLAFTEKIQETIPGGGEAQHRRGCNCKKSRCLKKYCECFQAGVPCGDTCKCEGCHNTSETLVGGKLPLKPRGAVAADSGAMPLPLPVVPGSEANGGNGSSRDGAPAAADGTADGRAVSPGTAAHQQAYAAFGPAFQQLLLQRALGGASGGAGAALAAAAAAAAAATATNASNGGSTSNTVTVNNQLLVPIQFNPQTQNAAATQQLLKQLAASGSIPGLTQAALTALTTAATAAQQQLANGGGSGSLATPSVVPSSQDPSSAQLDQPASQEGTTDGSGGAAAAVNGVNPTAVADSGMALAESARRGASRRKGGVTSAPLPPPPPAAAGASPTGARLTPTKRKPARTMTAALM